jgi:two-component system nitrogen regulation response regulator GlnG
LLDDDIDFSEALRDELRQLGHEVVCLEMAEDGLGLLAAAEKIDLVLLDNLMPRMSGLEFLAALRQRNLDVPVVLMTSAHNDRTAIQATNLGAFDYVLKPRGGEPILGELGPVIPEALKIRRPPERVALPRPDAQDPEEGCLIVGRSKPVREVLRRIGQLVRVDETVLILGETGTGKDLVARAIHTNSSRKTKPFVVINCTALTESLLNDELFGHEPGAFTGAEKLRKGRFEHAHGGTLFLDEVGDMPLALQATLLRVLENREVVRIGGNDPIRVDVRVLAATHRDLKNLVREGKFRQDLFYRLEGMTIHLPPLRERKEDVEILARCFLARLFGGASSAPSLAPAALEALRNHPWPGNVRQLQKVLCRAAGAVRGSVILPGDLDFGELDTPSPGAAGEEAGLAGLRHAVAWAWDSKQADIWPLLEKRLEEELLRLVVTRHEGSEVQLAKLLGMARNTLRDRLHKYGLQLPARGGPP